MRPALFLICATFVLGGCFNRHCTGGDDCKGPTTSAAPATATPSPAPVPSTPPPSPFYTGRATLEKADQTYLYGYVTADDEFAPCGASPVPIASDDTVLPGGTCSQDLLFETAALGAARRIAPGATVQNVAVDGDTAIATYSHGGVSGQILLKHSTQGWTAVRSAPRVFVPSDNIGVSDDRLQALQTRIRLTIGAQATATP
jgi:hypothetical protein